MDITNELRLICGHDSHDVDGCVTCEAATLIESLRQQLAEKVKKQCAQVIEDWDSDSIDPREAADAIRNLKELPK